MAELAKVTLAPRSAFPGNASNTKTYSPTTFTEVTLCVKSLNAQASALRCARQSQLRDEERHREAISVSSQFSTYRLRTPRATSCYQSSAQELQVG